MIRLILDFLNSVFNFSTQKEEFNGINVSMNSIHYPDNTVCKCGNKVDVTPQTIDSGTWNLICSCGGIAYEHPKRFERQQQIEDMLNY